MPARCGYQIVDQQNRVVIASPNLPDHIILLNLKILVVAVIFPKSNWYFSNLPRRLIESIGKNLTRPQSNVLIQTDKRFVFGFPIVIWVELIGFSWLHFHFVDQPQSIYAIYLFLFYHTCLS